MGQTWVKTERSTSGPCARECAGGREAIVEALGRQDTEDELAWPCLDDVLWAEAIITSRAFYLSNVVEDDGDDDDDDDEEGDDRDDREADGVEPDDEIDERNYEFIKALNAEDDDDDDDDDVNAADDDGVQDDDDDTFEAFGGAAVDGEGGKIRGGGDDDPWETGDTFLALVPWADALNHDVNAGPEACLTYYPAGKEVHSIPFIRDYLLIVYPVHIHSIPFRSRAPHVYSAQRV